MGHKRGAWIGMMAGVAALFWGCGLFASQGKRSCAFCDDRVIDRQMVWEEKGTEVLFSYQPITEGHLLAISRGHAERLTDLDSETWEELYRTCQKVGDVLRAQGAGSILWIEKNGPEAGQDVPHVHIHAIPRGPGQKSWVSLLSQMLFSQVRSAMSLEQMVGVKALWSERFAKEIETRKSPEVSEECACSLCQALQAGRVLYEGKEIRVIAPEHPLGEGHCYFVPKMKRPDLAHLALSEWKEILPLCQKVDRAVQEHFGGVSFLFKFSEGEGGGQEYPHLYFEYIPKKKGSYPWALAGKILRNQMFPSALDQEATQTLREALRDCTKT